MYSYMFCDTGDLFFIYIVLLCSVTKGVKRMVSTMYFYITEYGQYIHSGSNPQIHNWLASGESILLLSSSAPDIHNGF